MKEKDEIVQALQQSNFIEDVRDGDSLDQAVYAWQYIIKQKTLNISAVLKTHKILMLHQHLQPDEKGYLRKVPVWIGGREGKPWYALPELMMNWVGVVNETISVAIMAGTNEANRRQIAKSVHVAFETIHPFIDGNGRMGRILLNWHLTRLALPIMIIREDEKWEYYKWFNENTQDINQYR